jgi:extracellular factor (EF) 3-hydroxypalmitic acid methyl ester biosynthesis protein
MSKANEQVNNVLAVIEQLQVKKRVSDFLLKDLNKYAENLFKLEQKLESKRSNPSDVTKKYNLLTDEIIEKAGELEQLVDQKYYIDNIKRSFRTILSATPAYKSLLIKRAFDKPRGYPGDFQMIESFYNNKPVSEGIGKCGDKYLLSDNYVSVVRKRKDSMNEILGDFIKNSKSSSIKILNIGCGSSREIRELIENGLRSDKKVVFTLVDQDNDALDFSRTSLDELVKLNGNVQFKYVKENVLNLFRNNKYNNLLKGQNLIYSIGLADYLPDIYLGKLIKFCFEILTMKGELIIAHKNIKKYKAVAPDWFCGWTFFPRDKKELVNLVKTYLGDASYDMKIRREKLKYVFFMDICKL